MLLSLEEAAKRANLTLEELQQNIKEGRLATVANTGDEDTAQVDEKNLEHFINKRPLMPCGRILKRHLTPIKKMHLQNQMAACGACLRSKQLLI